MGARPGGGLFDRKDPVRPLTENEIARRTRPAPDVVNGVPVYREPDSRNG
jgi:hypothetical protein